MVKPQLPPVLGKLSEWTGRSETETFLTRAITIVALTCFLVVGAAAASILGRDSVPPLIELASARRQKSGLEQGSQEGPAGGRRKCALASFEPPQATAGAEQPLRQAFASTAPAESACRK